MVLVRASLVALAAMGTLLEVPADGSLKIDLFFILAVALRGLHALAAQSGVFEDFWKVARAPGTLKVRRITRL